MQAREINDGHDQQGLQNRENIKETQIDIETEVQVGASSKFGIEEPKQPKNELQSTAEAKSFTQTLGKYVCLL